MNPFALSNPTLLARRAPWLLLAVSLAVLGTVFVMEYGGGLPPCVLCLYERVPFFMAVPLSLLALWLDKGRGGALVLAVIALAFLVGAGIGAFHVGVEQHWWTGTSSCTGADGDLSSLEALKAQILAAPVVRCDQVRWSLFGLSLAGYNALLSLALAGFSLFAAQRRNRSHP